MVIQIYEVQSPKEADALTAMGVDHVGSVIPSRSQWKVPEIRETVRQVENAGARSSLIPLFSDPDAVLRTLDYYRPHIVHFCEALDGAGREAHSVQTLVDLQVQVKKRFPEIRIMRSIPIAQDGLAHRVPTLKIAALFEPYSDLFLTDTLLLSNAAGSTAAQPVKGFVGITGKICDWGMAGRLVEASKIPVILAGGITPENVREGICRVRPHGVDSCTGTNASDARGGTIRFQKDLDKVQRMVKAVRDLEPDK